MVTCLACLSSSETKSMDLKHVAGHSLGVKHKRREIKRLETLANLSQRSGSSIPLASSSSLASAQTVLLTEQDDPIDYISHPPAEDPPNDGIFNNAAQEVQNTMPTDELFKILQEASNGDLHPIKSLWDVPIQNFHLDLDRNREKADYYQDLAECLERGDPTFQHRAPQVPFDGLPSDAEASASEDEDGPNSEGQLVYLS